MVRAIIRGYLWAGLAFGLVGFVSYVWGAFTVVSCGGGAWLFFMSIGYGIIGGAVRALLWLPSLVSWVLMNTGTSFLFWLMPGLFVQCGGT
jgi:hypothetical protein